MKMFQNISSWTLGQSWKNSVFKSKPNSTFHTTLKRFTYTLDTKCNSTNIVSLVHYVNTRTKVNYVCTTAIETVLQAICSGIKWRCPGCLYGLSWQGVHFMSEQIIKPSLQYCLYSCAFFIPNLININVTKCYYVKCNNTEMHIQYNTTSHSNRCEI